MVVSSTLPRVSMLFDVTKGGPRAPILVSCQLRQVTTSCDHFLPKGHLPGKIIAEVRAFQLSCFLRGAWLTRRSAHHYLFYPLYPLGPLFFLGEGGFCYFCGSLCCERRPGLCWPGIAIFTVWRHNNYLDLLCPQKQNKEPPSNVYVLPRFPRCVWRWSATCARMLMSFAYILHMWVTRPS